MVLRKSAYAIVALVMLGCGGGGGSTGVGGGGGGTTCAANSVCMSGSAFFPLTLTAVRGNAVAFVNGASVEHNVIFDTNAPPEGNISKHSSGSNSRTMSIAGTTKFHCSIHGTTTSGMMGEIVVSN